MTPFGSISVIVLAGVIAFALGYILAQRGIALGPMAINRRGESLALHGGIVVLVSAIASIAIASVLAMLARTPGDADMLALGVSPGQWLGVGGLVSGFFILGFLDDRYGSRSSRGFRGHLAALRKGKVTTGAIKAAGGVLLGFLGAAWFGSSGTGVILDGLTIAVIANLLNLLDVRPGRATKAFLLLTAALAAPVWTGVSEVSVLFFASAGAAAGWIYFDLTEKGMLGDSGANALGALIGGFVVLSLGDAATLVVLAIALGLTIASELWSFSAAIARIPPLRFLDDLGTLP